ncbi:UvrD-helicase domain-containing protein [Klebsiella variicola]
MSVINISDNDILYAESILLKNGDRFDQERIDFIKNLQTIDLQAVPGSGKSTALLAKLLILERYMPFSDGRGILVISHTNAAIDELKSRIGKYCPKLFTHPNFIGTIQSFTNTYLAGHYLKLIFNTQLRVVDDQQFTDSLIKYYTRIKWDDNYGNLAKFFYGRNIKEAKRLGKILGNEDSKSINKICELLIEENIKKLHFDFIERKFQVSGESTVLLSDEKNLKFNGLEMLFTDTFKNGILSYRYAYLFANEFITIYPKIIDTIGNRFQYAFVDEMQDMDALQYSLLENCLHNGKTVYQRIGDNNQAIYNTDNEESINWIGRPSTLNIQGSHRLSSPIANVVSKLSLTHAIVIGNNNQSKIKPIILCYRSQDIKKVIPKFNELYDCYLNSGQIPKLDNPLRASIAWVAKPREDDKLSLVHFINIDSLPELKSNDLNTLHNYFLVLLRKSNVTISDTCDLLINSTLFLLKSYSIKDANGYFYTKKTLIEYIKKLDEKHYENLKKILYRVASKFILGDEVYFEMSKKTIIWIFKKISEIDIHDDNFFLQDAKTIITATPIIKETRTKRNSEHYTGTIHSVKGQTHSATLYLETYFKKNYESFVLNEFFEGRNCVDIINSIKDEIDKIEIEITKLKNGYGEKTRKAKIKTLQAKIVLIERYAKMMYVGFSRPQHLLCFAIDESRCNQLQIDTTLWDVINV